MKVVFMGSSPFAMPSLSYLYEKHELLCIYTKPAKPANRGMKLTPSDSEIFALNNNVPYLTPSRFTPDEIETLKAMNADCIVVASYGLILPSAVLNAAKYPAVNLHGSILPHLRGAAPIQHAILRGDEICGVTLQVMTKEVDAGDILLQQELQLNHTETHESLLYSLGLFGPTLLDEFFSNPEGYLNNRIIQDSTFATFAPKIQKSEYKINFETEEAIQIERKIRAFNGNCWAVFDNIRIKILDAEIIPNDERYSAQNSGFYGDIVDKYFTIHTKKGFIRLLTIKPDGKKEMAARDFLNGHKHLVTIKHH